MCICCRGRFEQKALHRLQCKNQSIIKYEGIGRSFYVCENCVESKKLEGLLAKECKIPKNTITERIQELKEIFFNAKSART